MALITSDCINGPNHLDCINGPNHLGLRRCCCRRSGSSGAGRRRRQQRSSARTGWWDTAFALCVPTASVAEALPFALCVPLPPCLKHCICLACSTASAAQAPPFALRTAQEAAGGFDLVLAADVMYKPDLPPLLFGSVKQLLRKVCTTWTVLSISGPNHLGLQ